MTALVADSSALIELVLGTAKGHGVNERRSRVDVTLHIPELCPVEVVSALRGLVLGHKMTARRAAAAVVDFTRIAATRHSAQPTLSRMWELRDNLTTSDATYVALAESLECPLVTTDRKFDTPTVRRLITVEVIS